MSQVCTLTGRCRMLDRCGDGKRTERAVAVGLEGARFAKPNINQHGIMFLNSAKIASKMGRRKRQNQHVTSSTSIVSSSFFSSLSQF